ncbi:MAG TPA: hypothetical protein VND43_05505 [Burkholderiales bacterium]|nr:hypothetical protein [Burkholderiales bacterium]
MGQGQMLCGKVSTVRCRRAPGCGPLDQLHPGHAPRYKLFAFEVPRVRNMTRKARPKQDRQGRWVMNGAATKSGLNKSILPSIRGQMKTYLQYKARRQGKLVTDVTPFYSCRNVPRAATFTRTIGYCNPTSSAQAAGTPTMRITMRQRLLPCVVSGSYWTGSVFRKKRSGAGSPVSR